MTTPSSSAPVPETPPASPPMVLVPATPAVPLSYTRKVLIAVSISVAALLLTAFVYFTAQILVLVFAGIVFSVFLSAPSELLAKYTRIRRSYALGIVVGTLFVVVVLGGYLMGYTVYKQGEDLKTSVPKALDKLGRDLEKYFPAPREAATMPGEESATATAPGTATAPALFPETRLAAGSTTRAAIGPATAPAANSFIADRIRDLRGWADDILTSGAFWSNAKGVASTTFGLFGNLIVVLGIGLFFAIAPGAYATGALRVVPPAHRPRVSLIMSEIGGKLQWWFVGQLCSMLTVAVLAYIGLTILGVPMAFTLAILAGLLNFVPYVGPMMAAAPAVLMALAPHGDQTSLNPGLAGWTIGLYVVIQLLDGWIFTPFYQKKAVDIPPALIILAQVVFSMLLGPIGLVLATPILATVLVLIRTIYVEDILGDKEPEKRTVPAPAAPKPSSS